MGREIATLRRCSVHKGHCMLDGSAVHDSVYRDAYCTMSKPEVAGRMIDRVRCRLSTISQKYTGFAAPVKRCPRASLLPLAAGDTRRHSIRKVTLSTTDADFANASKRRDHCTVTVQSLNRIIFLTRIQNLMKLRNVLPPPASFAGNSTNLSSSTTLQTSRAIKKGATWPPDNELHAADQKKRIELHKGLRNA